MAENKKPGGLLNEPMPPYPTNGMALSEEIRQKTTAQYIDLELQKLDLLSQQYDLIPQDYLSLALALAREHHDGFKQAKPRLRRPKKWDNQISGFLFVDVKRKIIELGLKENEITAATTEVAKQPHWANFLECVEGTGITPDPAEAIRKAYYKAAKDFWSRILWLAYLSHESNKTVDEWDENVATELGKFTQNEII